MGTMANTFKSWLTETTVPCGECFQYAFRLYRDFLDRGENAALVHGEITHPLTGEKIQHAWVVWNGNVYDWQSGGKRSTVKEFKQLWKPVVSTTYLPSDRPEVLTSAVRSNHYGPWEN